MHKDQLEITVTFQLLDTITYLSILVLSATLSLSRELDRATHWIISKSYSIKPDLKFASVIVSFILEMFWHPFSFVCLSCALIACPKYTVYQYPTAAQLSGLQ